MRRGFGPWPAAGEVRSCRDMVPWCRGPAVRSTRVSTWVCTLTGSRTGTQAGSQTGSSREKFRGELQGERCGAQSARKNTSKPPWQGCQTGVPDRGARQAAAVRPSPAARGMGSSGTRASGHASARQGTSEAGRLLPFFCCLVILLHQGGKNRFNHLEIKAKVTMHIRFVQGSLARSSAGTMPERAR